LSTIQLQQEHEYQLCDSSYKIVPKSRHADYALGQVWMCDLYVGPNLYPDAALYSDDGVLAAPVIYVAPLCFWDSFHDSPLNTEVDWGLLDDYEPPPGEYKYRYPGDWGAPTCDCGHDRHKFIGGHANWCTLKSSM
jgi:hypothetical protein